LSAIKKGTKLTDNPKDYMLRVRFDSSTLSKLDEICLIEDKTRSQTVRGLIEEKYRELKK